jgi:hypothetical protein
MDRKYRQAAKKYAADFLNKAAKRHAEKRKKEKKERAAADVVKNTEPSSSAVRSTTPPNADLKEEEEDDDEVQVSDDDMLDAGEDQNGFKRKRDSETPASPVEHDSGLKKLKVDPPPPPPPPTHHDGSATPKDDAPQQEPSPTSTNESDRNDFAKSAMVDGHRSPVQLATPLTNGSAGHTNGH